MDKILILDFGGQTTGLIARRIRDFGVYTDIIHGDSTFSPSLLEGVKGIILGGSPYSVYAEDAPQVDHGFLEAGLPVLGICYGLQRITQDLGGKVEQKHVREFGRNKLSIASDNKLLAGVPSGFLSWMSHGDSIAELANGFEVLARSENGHPAAVVNPARKLWGVQFHPEVSHCEYGTEILKNFVLGICGAEISWSIEKIFSLLETEVREKAGDSDVLLLISGGVDSTVLGGLLLRVLDPARVHLMYIDTGLMRKDESVQVSGSLKKLGATHLHIIHAEEDFLAELAGVEDPEKKREAIGDTFIRVQEREVARLGLQNYLLAQGTLYTDLIESGKGVGKKAQVIKSHHNVRSPLVEKKRAAGQIIEPLGRLYKDEVRALGRLIGIHPDIVDRHPFPGPGLGVRILGEVTRAKCEVLREADAIFLSELRSRGLYSKIWQAFMVLLPVRSVGVAGDAREYGWVAAMRAIVSADGMTADVYPFDMKDLLEISAIITNKVREIGRVVYDVSSKPPATIEWE